MERSRFASLDEAVEYIERLERAKQKERKAQEVQDDRWWSYTNNGDTATCVDGVVSVRIIPEESLTPADKPVCQKCGGGRRVIHKRLGGN